jgi:hypothetical protein
MTRPPTDPTAPPPQSPLNPDSPPAPAWRRPRVLIVSAVAASIALLLCAGSAVAVYGLGRKGEASSTPTVSPSPPLRTFRLGSSLPPLPTGDPVQGVPNGDPATHHLLVFEATGDGTATVIYEAGLGFPTGVPVTLPWRKDFDVKGDVPAVNMIVARTSSGQGSITCRVLYDGKVVLTKKSSGVHAEATCSGMTG